MQEEMPVPLPVVKAKQAIAQLEGPGQVEVLVDNEIAVQNLTKMARQKGSDPGRKAVSGTVPGAVYGRTGAGGSGPRNGLYTGRPHRSCGGH